MVGLQPLSDRYTLSERSGRWGLDESVYGVAGDGRVLDLRHSLRPRVAAALAVAILVGFTFLWWDATRTKRGAVDVLDVRIVEERDAVALTIRSCNGGPEPETNYVLGTTLYVKIRSELESDEECADGLRIEVDTTDLEEVFDLHSETSFALRTPEE